MQSNKNIDKIKSIKEMTLKKNKGKSRLYDFIKSGGRTFPDSFMHYTHAQELEHMCVFCIKEDHMTYLEINRGVNRAYACSSCANKIKTASPALYRRLDVQKQVDRKSVV